MRNNFKKSGFTLAEMMIVIVVVSLIAVGAVPLVTTKRIATDKSPWHWSDNDSDIWASNGETQTAIIGQSDSVSNPAAKLFIKTTTDVQDFPLVYYDTNGNIADRGHLMFGKNVLSIGNMIPDISSNNHSNVFIGTRYINPNRAYSSTDYEPSPGSDNVAIGHNAFTHKSSVSTVGGNNNVAIGIQALENASCNNCVGFIETNSGEDASKTLNGNYLTAIGTAMWVSDYTTNNKSIVKSTFIGRNNMISGTGNTVITGYNNYRSVASNSGLDVNSDYNTILGSSVGYYVGPNVSSNKYHIPGYYNTLLGNYAGQSYTNLDIGNDDSKYDYFKYNTYIDIYSGFYNRDASTEEALTFGNSHEYNVAIGSYAGYTNFPQRHYNISIGQNAGRHTDALGDIHYSENTINVGYSAGYDSYSSQLDSSPNGVNNFSSNINIGYFAGANQKDDSAHMNMISIGYKAGYGISGNKSIAIGANALSLSDNNHQYSDNSIAIGYNAGIRRYFPYNITDSKPPLNNVAIGYNACSSMKPRSSDAAFPVEFDNITCIGYNSDKPTNHEKWSHAEAGSHEIFIGNTNLYVPHKHDNTDTWPDDENLPLNTNFYDGIKTGDESGNPKIQTIPEFHYIYIPGKLVVNGSMTFIDDNCVNKYDGRCTAGYKTSDGLIYHTYDYNDDTDDYAELGFNVGMTTYDYNNDDTYEVQYQGHTFWPSPVEWSLGETVKLKVLQSDRRLKDIIGENKDGLKKINKLKVYNFTFKNDKTKTPHVGVIAQDLMKVFPNAVSKDKNGYYLIRKEDIFYAMINAVKELDNKVKFMISQLKEIFTKVAEIDLKLTKLENSSDELKTQVVDIDKRIKILEDK